MMMLSQYIQFHLRQIAWEKFFRKHTNSLCGSLHGLGSALYVNYPHGTFGGLKFFCISNVYGNLHFHHLFMNKDVKFS